MPQYHFRLQTLLKLRIAERRQRQLHLAEALQAAGILRQQLDSIGQEIQQNQEDTRRKVRPGSVDVDAIRDASRYELILKTRAVLLRQQEQQLEVEVQRRRQSLVDADQQVRMLENLRERQLAEHQQSEARHEVKLLDEVAQRVHLGQGAEPWAN